ncbi:MAG: hypothetical protein IPO21_21495 [Bacteroidales bacterium]|nr:hypothetical protein [Bacteroidales bacterium]
MALIVCLFSACSSGLEEHVLSQYPNGTPMQIEFYLKNDSLKVPVKEVRYNLDGEKEHEGTFENGKKHGLWKSWYTNGEKKSEYNFSAGMKNGEFTEWYDNGNIMFQGSYANDMPSGRWIFWNIEGKLEREKQY